MLKDLGIGLCTLALLLATGHADAAVWGGFDGTRVNYAGGVLSGSAHTSLQGYITANGDTVGSMTPTLTPAYLNTVDVFYTSLLKNQAIDLTAAEQSALQAWIAAGGTLILTADIYGLTTYDTFTAVYGVSNYQSGGGASPATTVAAHPIVAGVTTAAFTTRATFNVPGNALVLMNDGGNNPFALVMEPSTGFNVGGRILVFGDHNMFTQSFITQQDNAALAQNFVSWAAAATPGCTTNAQCDDNNVCNGVEVCINSQCVPSVALNCDDLNPCTTDLCDAVNGCANVNNSDPCDDGNQCTENDVCGAGMCGGSAVVCDDSNACTSDSCEPAAGCVFANNTDACDDGDLCTTNDVCSGGTCVPGTPLGCDDSNECTDDSCDAMTGCVNAANTASCDDGDACTSGDMCAAGSCAGGTMLQCDDNDVCTADSCDINGGCVHDAIDGCCSAPSDCPANETCGADNTCVPDGGSGGNGSGGNGIGGDDVVVDEGCGCVVVAPEGTSQRPAWMLLGLGLGLAWARRRQGRRQA